MSSFTWWYFLKTQTHKLPNLNSLFNINQFDYTSTYIRKTHYNHSKYTSFDLTLKHHKSYLTCRKIHYHHSKYISFNLKLHYPNCYQINITWLHFLNAIIIKFKLPKLFLSTPPFFFKFRYFFLRKKQTSHENVNVKM